MNAVFSTLLAALIAGACGTPAAAASDVPAPGTPLPDRLADTGLYLPGTTSVRPELLPFSPQYPLWTDGAGKRRWIHLPENASIDASDPDAWRFPPGTRLWKEFSFGGHPVETRFIEVLADGSFRYATYLWDADGGEARLAPPRGVPEGVPVHGRAAKHPIPSEPDCRACHEASATPVLGFGALQLSSDRDPRAPHATSGPGDVDLEALVVRGLVRGLPAWVTTRPPRIQVASPVERAALGMLHGNCGHCHNARGPLAPVGLVLAQSVSEPHATAARSSAVAQPSQFRAPGHADAMQRVTPGRPDLSVLSLRMRSRDPLVQMPPLGTIEVDADAVALVDQWIQELATHQGGTP